MLPHALNKMLQNKDEVTNHDEHKYFVSNIIN